MLPRRSCVVVAAVASPQPSRSRRTAERPRRFSPPRAFWHHARNPARAARPQRFPGPHCFRPFPGYIQDWFPASRALQVGPRHSQGVRGLGGRARHEASARRCPRARAAVSVRPRDAVRLTRRRRGARPGAASLELGFAPRRPRPAPAHRPGLLRALLWPSRCAVGCRSPPARPARAPRPPFWLPRVSAPEAIRARAPRPAPRSSSRGAQGSRRRALGFSRGRFPARGRARRHRRVAFPGRARPSLPRSRASGCRACPADHPPRFPPAEIPCNHGGRRRDGRLRRGRLRPQDDGVVSGWALRRRRCARVWRGPEFSRASGAGDRRAGRLMLLICGRRGSATSSRGGRGRPHPPLGAAGGPPARGRVPGRRRPARASVGRFRGRCPRSLAAARPARVSRGRAARAGVCGPGPPRPDLARRPPRPQHDDGERPVLHGLG